MGTKRRRESTEPPTPSSDFSLLRHLLPHLWNCIGDHGAGQPDGGKEQNGRLRRPLWPLCLRVGGVQLLGKPRTKNLAPGFPPSLAPLLPPCDRPPHHEHHPRPLVPPHPVAPRLPLLRHHVHLHQLAAHAEAVPGHVLAPPLPGQPRR